MRVINVILSGAALVVVAGCLRSDPAPDPTCRDWPYPGACTHGEGGDAPSGQPDPSDPSDPSDPGDPGDPGGPDDPGNGNGGHPNAGRGNGPEGDPDQDPGNSGGKNQGGD